MKKVNRKKSKNFFDENFKFGWTYIKESKNFIYIVSFIFLLFILIGYFIPAPDFVSQLIVKFIEELLERTKDMSWAELTSFIFFNNLQSSFFGMIFGIVFGIFSVITVIVNGYLLGFVANVVVRDKGIFVLWRIFPHGIFEIPALLISMGLGLKLGTFIFHKNKLKSFRDFFIKSLKSFFFVVVPLLVLAALIESTLVFFFG